jgi:hypothetical protein
MAICECGCGRQTAISTRNRRDEGVSKGQPRRFFHGHNRRVEATASYRFAPRDESRVWVLAHRARAERALGRPLPPKAIVHHADGSRHEDAPLVICQDQKYHMLLHARMRVRSAGGNPNTDAVCGKCHKTKARILFGPSSRAPMGVRAECRECRSNDRQIAARG